MVKNKRDIIVGVFVNVACVRISFCKGVMWWLLEIGNNTSGRKPCTSIQSKEVGLLLWCGNSSHTNNLFKLQERAARIITNSDYSIGSTQILETLQWQPKKTILELNNSWIFFLLKWLALKLSILLAFCQSLSTVKQTMELWKAKNLGQACCQVRGNHIVKYLFFCASYVDLSLNLSGYFVFARVSKDVVVTVVLKNCSCLVKTYLTFELSIRVPPHIKTWLLEFRKQPKMPTY